MDENININNNGYNPNLEEDKNEENELSEYNDDENGAEMLNEGQYMDYTENENGEEQDINNENEYNNNEIEDENQNYEEEQNNNNNIDNDEEEYEIDDFKNPRPSGLSEEGE